MKITDIKTFAVSYPLKKPLRWGNLYCHAAGSVIIRVSTDEGITGYGEAGPHPTFYERIRNLVDTILKPLLLNRDPFDIERLWEAMYGATHGHGRRGVDTLPSAASILPYGILWAKLVEGPSTNYWEVIQAVSRPMLPRASRNLPLLPGSVRSLWNKALRQ